MAEDARYRTKVYWETYLTFKDTPGERNDISLIYKNPDYPAEAELSRFGGLFDVVVAIGEPNTSSMMDAVTQAPYGYEEHVPIHIIATDPKAKWQVEDAIRTVCKDYPFGSKRSLERRSDHERRLGSITLLDTEWDLGYRRDTT